MLLIGHRQRGARSCVEAYETLKAEGIRARVVSMPCWELFEQQPPEYRESVLPAAVTARVAVEQAATFGWDALRRPDRSDHRDEELRRLGAAQGSADQHFGFTTDHVVARRASRARSWRRYAVREQAMNPAAAAGPARPGDLARLHAAEPGDHRRAARLIDER